MFIRFVSVVTVLGFALMLNAYSLTNVDPIYLSEIAAVGATPDHAIPSELMHEQLVAFDLR